MSTAIPGSFQIGSVNPFGIAGFIEYCTVYPVGCLGVIVHVMISIHPESHKALQWSPIVPVNYPLGKPVVVSSPNGLTVYVNATWLEILAWERKFLRRAYEYRTTVADLVMVNPMMTPGALVTS